MLSSRTATALTTPQAVAVIGASSDPSKLSGRPVAYLKESGFQGLIVPVNPRQSCIQGLPSYPAVAAAPSPVDLAIVCLPAAEAAGAVRACAAMGVPLVVIFGSGFAEVGSTGSDRQAELAAAIEGTGTRLIGPNSLGLISQPQAVTATFSSLLYQRRDLLDGGVAFVSQSGALATWTLSAARNLGIGFRYFVSTGNEADLTAPEIAATLLYDPQVTFAVLYLEEVRDSSALRALANSSLLLDKPVLVIKVGSSAAGRAAAQLHTGALAGSEQVFQAWIEDSPLLRVRNVDDVLDAMILLSAGKRMAGTRLAIVTASGGAGALAADIADRCGLTVPALSPERRQRLDAILPAFASSRNPVDVTAGMLNNPAVVRGSLDITLNSPEVDGIAVLLGAADGVEDDLIEDLASVCRAARKPVTVTWIGAAPGVIERLLSLGVPAYPDVGRAIRSIGLLSAYGAKRADGMVRPPDRQTRHANVGSTAAERGIVMLDEFHAKKVLARAGLPVVSETIAADPAAAVRAARDLRGPVAVKLLAPGLTHKSHVNAVRLDLSTDDQVLGAAASLLALAGRLDLPDARLLVQEYEPGLCELILGARRDEAFGPIIVCGVGGVLAEVFADTAIAFAPLHERDARRALDRLRGQALFDGSRGRPPGDITAVVEVMCGLSRLAMELGEDLVEIDVNPLVVRPSPRGAVIVDASLAVRPEFGHVSGLPTARGPDQD